MVTSSDYLVPAERRIACSGLRSRLAPDDVFAQVSPRELQGTAVRDGGTCRTVDPTSRAMVGRWATGLDAATGADATFSRKPELRNGRS